MSLSEGSTRQPRFSILLGVLAFTVFTNITSIAMLGPLLVDMAAGLNTTVPVVAQLVAVSSMAWALAALSIGPFSDTYGRKPVLLLGTLLVVIGSLGTASAPGFAMAAVFRVMSGIGGGIVSPTCLALIGDVFPERRRAMSVATITVQPGLSSLLGIPLAAVLADFAGWRSPFVAAGITMLLASLALAVLCPRYRPQATGLPLMGRLRRVFAFPFTWHMAVSNMIARMAFGVIITFFPAYLILTHELSTAGVALPMAVVAIGATLGPLLGGKIGGSHRRMSMTATAVLAATVPGLAVFLLGWGMWLSVLVAGLFVMLVIPVTTILSIACTESGGPARGTLTGLISSSNWGGTAVGVGIGGLLVAQVGYGALSFQLAAATMGSGLLLTLFLQEGAVGRARRHFSDSQ
ncbi:MAG: MFS transporter [Dehalococcoidia bacterium]|nr:MFS transporter [Dehalococcoidia bacterium]MDP6783107.1 MFS transporter [Dehalococcoidia bacterium]